MKKIITHSGDFHADDVFAVATIELAFPDLMMEVVRTRDSEIIAVGDFVVDVGAVYDSEANKFDHHQGNGAGIRENTIPFASFGLVWKKFGAKVCGNPAVADAIEKRLVEPIDAMDNGISLSKSLFSDTNTYTIQDLIGNFIPTWKEADVFLDKNFLEAVELAKKIIEREIVVESDNVEGMKIVEEIYNETPDKRIIMMEKKYPWHDVLSKFNEPLYVVYPSRNGAMWYVKAVKDSPYSFTARKDLPASWAGKRNKELQELSGVGDALFCHNGRFVATVKSKEGAEKLAKIATERPVDLLKIL